MSVPSITAATALVRRTITTTETSNLLRVVRSALPATPLVVGALALNPFLAPELLRNGCDEYFYQAVNPWTWQDQFGFSQAIGVTPPSRFVFCAGQASVDADGNVLHTADIGAQLTQSFNNLETVLQQAGTDLSHVVRLNLYTTDVDGLLGAWHLIVERLEWSRLPPDQHSARCRTPRLSGPADRDRSHGTGAITG